MHTLRCPVCANDEPFQYLATGCQFRHGACSHGQPCEPSNPRIWTQRSHGQPGSPGRNEVCWLQPTLLGLACRQNQCCCWLVHSAIHPPCRLCEKVQDGQLAAAPPKGHADHNMTHMQAAFQAGFIPPESNCLVKSEFTSHAGRIPPRSIMLADAAGCMGGGE